MNLGTPKRIFGFELSGDPVEKKYVTSLFVLYSLDNVRYSYVTDAGGSVIYLNPPPPSLSSHSMLRRINVDVFECRQSQTVLRGAGTLNAEGAHVLQSIRGAVRADGAAVVVPRHRHAVRIVRMWKHRRTDNDAGAWADRSRL